MGWRANWRWSSARGRGPADPGRQRQVSSSRSSASAAASGSVEIGDEEEAAVGAADHRERLAGHVGASARELGQPQEGARVERGDLADVVGVVAEMQERLRRPVRADGCAGERRTDLGKHAGDVDVEQVLAAAGLRVDRERPVGDRLVVHQRGARVPAVAPEVGDRRAEDGRALDAGDLAVGHDQPRLRLRGVVVLDDDEAAGAVDLGAVRLLRVGEAGAHRR